jgi:phosphate-selective porin
MGNSGMVGRGARLVRHSAFFALAAIVAAGAASGQDKKESPAVTASRSFQLSGYTQFLYNYFEKGVDSFSIPRARLTLSGGLVKNVRFKIQIDGVKSPALIDAMLDVQFKPYFGLRVGQYYVPFSLENTTSDSDLDLINRSQVVNSLAPGRDIGAQGRDIGGMLMGKYSIFEYYAGVFNGAGINRLDTNKDKDVSARLIVRPVRGLAVGGSLYGGRYSATQGAPAVTRNKAGLEAVFTTGALCLKGEFISAKDDLTSKSGWYAQGTYDFLKRKFQAAARWDTLDPNLDLGENRLDNFTLGGTWFIWEKTKLMVNYILSRAEGQGTTNQTLAVQFQAAF